MCGIAGVISREPRDHARLAEMVEALAHRGPDDAGQFCWEDTVALGHRRLSILDLSSAGHQPMSTADGRYHVTYNGEIYNFIELRTELERAGRVFTTSCDTEVLLEAWSAWGADSVKRFTGMFAFALLDTQERTLHLVRDHFGIKPLYCATPNPGLFLFASELPALLVHPEVSRRAEPTSVYEYLRWGRTDHSERTMFASVTQIPPATIMSISIDEPSVHRTQTFWSLPADTLDLGFDEAVHELRDLFIDSVRLHMRSDVPVGSALSGGLDSSSIVAVMRELAGPHLELHAFSYVAADPALDESQWLELAADRAGAIVHEVRVDADDLERQLDPLVRAQGEPFGGTSLLAQSEVFAEASRAGVTVLLDGQGADELFGGYRSFLAHRFATLVRHGSLGAAVKLARSVRRLPDVALDRQTAAAVAAMVAPRPLRRPLQRLAGREPFPSWCDRRWFEQRGVLDAPDAADGGRRSAFGATSLPALLRYEDRNSMRFSRESRVPFLSAPLVDFVFKLPSEHLVGLDGTSKLIFREAMRGLMPDSILDRRDKIGFTTPEAAWLRRHTHLVDATLDRAASRGDTPLHVSECRRIASRGADPSRLGAHDVWRWINLVRWTELFDVEL